MASITTILGTDSVSSSRIVFNNNFAALNTELSDIATLFNTTTQTITLTGEVACGALKVNNGTIDTFKVTTTSATISVESTFSKKITMSGSAIIEAIESAVTTIPIAGEYKAATYVLDASGGAFSSAIVLPAATTGQKVTFVSDGGPITFDVTNVMATSVAVAAKGSVTFVYDGTTSKFYIVSSVNATIAY